MEQVDFIARALTGIISCGFLLGGIFGVLDYAIVQFLLIGTFSIMVIYMLYQWIKNENHPQE